MKDWFDKIDDYLENNLPPADKTAFEIALKSDPDLAAELQLARLEMQAGELFVEESLRQKARAWEQERQQHREKSRYNWLKNPLFWLGAALVLALFWYWLRPDTPSKTIENQPVATESPAEKPSSAEPAPNIAPPNKNDTPTKTQKTPSPRAQPSYLAAAERLYQVPLLAPVRGTAESAETHPFNRALALFQKNEFENAAALLGSPEKPWFESGVFLRGHALFRARKFELAAADFKLLVERNSLIYSADARWNLALCYLAQQPRFGPELKKLLTDVRAESNGAGLEKFAELEAVLR